MKTNECRRLAEMESFQLDVGGPGLRVRAGFTLLELLVALTVLAIVMGIAMPRIDVDESRMNAATQSVGSTLLMAQRLAVTLQHDVVLAFDDGNGVIRVHEDANNNGVIDEGERVTHVELGEGVLFGLGNASPRPMGADAIVLKGEQGGLPALTFHRDGSASEEGGFYITSRRAQVVGGYPQDTRAVEVERATGRPSWYRAGINEWHRGF